MTKAQQRYSTPKSKNIDEGNPVWFKPIMFGFLLLGLIWILVYYLSSARLPIAVLGDWNLLIGIGVAMVGFLMMTNWK
ncbi:cell division protein CrgA [Gulosibacter macacae]|uniref:Cell division protein CrgA n=2 Tax=Gulosibacter macacae TaxID=2488791 RepID=A0A3P3VYF5_9MICO|nr:cell division protein CrgA [Gulosibacter macacae]